jgi:lipopolysaccharide/colanic/teichoic acid biosynthesis glycosyltransferase
MSNVQLPILRHSDEEVGVLPRMSGQPRLAGPSVKRDGPGHPFRRKYAIDRLLAAALLVPTAPLLLLCGASVKLSSPGPALFRQRRVGPEGQDFVLLKFRSMRRAHEGAEAFVPGRELAPGGVEGMDRRTRVGRILRRWDLDELPQLINVLRGEMSLVGPRPERPEFVARFTHSIVRYDERHRVKGGITGWAQVNGLRGQTSLADRIEFDNHYIDNWSPRLEIEILLRTASAVLGGESVSHDPIRAPADRRLPLRPLVRSVVGPAAPLARRVPEWAAG